MNSLIISNTEVWQSIQYTYDLLIYSPISAILPEEASNKKRLNSENLDLFR